MLRHQSLSANAIATFAIPIVLLALPCPARCAEKSAHELDLKTQRVIVFKDGYALVIKHGTARADSRGEVFTDEVPDAAVLGSFWAVPDQGRLISMTAGWKTTTDSQSKEIACTQMVEILLSNKGKQARVGLDGKGSYRGIIHDVLVEKSETPIDELRLTALDVAAAKKPHWGAAHAAPASSTPDTTERHTLTTVSGASFILRTEEGDVLLPIGSIGSLVIKDMKTTLAKTLATTSRAKRLSFHCDAADKSCGLTLMYFRPGIRWIPTYRVQLGEQEGKKSASIALQAELLDEAEDFDEVPVDIVVGVPNFRFRTTPSPFVLEATLRNALAEAAPQIMGNGSNAFSNASYSQRSSEFRRSQARASGVSENGVVNLPDELTAAGSQDLFVYNLPKIALAKGERCGVPIFTAEAPYHDVYTWDVRVTRQDVGAVSSSSSSSSSSQSPLVLAKNEVWHQILLTNATNLPWTTGAAMILQGNQPLAQELLTYTPPKDEVRVPVTVAVDLRGSLTEKEVGRDLKSLSWGGYNYAQIDKETRLDLCNNKSVEVEAEITLHVGGKVDEASLAGEIVLSAFDSADWTQYQGDPAVNNSSVVTWKVKLKPGETFTPTVRSHYFTRH